MAKAKVMTIKIPIKYLAVMHDSVRQEFELVEDELIDTAQASHSEQFHQQEHARIDSNQPRHRSRERWQAQRHGFPGSTHGLTSSPILLACSTRLMPAIP